jgi:circadian clock protein KaiC
MGVEKNMPPKMKTGITGLDTILDGGFLCHNALLLKGAPGTGKTTLGIQIIRNGAALFDEAGIIVLFEQFPQQLFRDLTSYNWNIEALIKEKKITIVFAQPEEVVAKENLSDAPLISKIHDIVVDTSARRIMIDGFGLFLNSIKIRLDERELFLRFINTLKSIGLTPIITTEGGGQDDKSGYEEYLVDSVVILTAEASKDKTFPMRFLEMKKTRGQSHIRGKHPYKIGVQGIEIFPHLLPGRFADQTISEFHLEKASSGINGLDHLLGGGYTRGTSTIIAGMPGTFKTTAGAQFLSEGANTGENGLLITFNENPSFLASIMDQKGLGFSSHLAKGTIRVWHFFPKDFYMDELMCLLAEDLEKGKTKRVVVDGINEMERSIEDPATYKDYLSAFLTLLGRHRIPSLFIQKLDQLPGSAPLTSIKYASLFDGIVFLGTVEIESAVHKVLSILKMRGGNFSSDLREIKCGANGLYVLDKFVGLSGILAGNPQGQYKKTVEEIFQPLYFLRDFIELMASSDLAQEQKVEIIKNLQYQVAQLTDKLTEYFDVGKEAKP